MEGWKQNFRHITNTVNVEIQNRCTGTVISSLLQRADLQMRCSVSFCLCRWCSASGAQYWLWHQDGDSPCLQSGITVPKFRWADWNLANRFIEASQPEALAKKLSHPVTNHKATDDTRNGWTPEGFNSCQTLRCLPPLWYIGMEMSLKDWLNRLKLRDASQKLRPAYLLDKLLGESGYMPTIRLIRSVSKIFK